MLIYFILLYVFAAGADTNVCVIAEDTTVLYLPGVKALLVLSTHEA